MGRISFGMMLLAGALGLGGGALAQGVPGVAPVAAAGASAPVASVEVDYTLGVADKVRVIVFNEPTLSGEFIVNANGALSFPLLGDIPASGLTPGQVAATIAARLRDGYVLKPSVSIDVLTFRPFYILGEVNKPGEYPYSNGLTVDAAVAQAQGYTYRADKRRVYIRHKGGNQTQPVELTPDLKVMPGDTIRIGERHW
jgi:protein involved in polysaccharide export with SLBB domain